MAIWRKNAFILRCLRPGVLKPHRSFLPYVYVCSCQPRANWRVCAQMDGIETCFAPLF